MVFVPWPSASEMSCGPNAVIWMSPVESAVRASANRWNITVSIWMLYFAAYSGSSQSGESAGTFSMPIFALTGAGSGLRRSPCASAAAGIAAANRKAATQRDTGRAHGIMRTSCSAVRFAGCSAAFGE
jgi:hypothetical protein